MLLVTRPLPDSIPLATTLQDMGFDVCIEPIISITTKTKQKQSLEDLLAKPPYAVILTSANGVRALAELSEERDIKIITVGPASYEKALEFGYKDVDMANIAYGGDVKGLVRHIKEKYSPEDGMFLHVSGQITAGELMQSLKNIGFQACSLPIYKTSYATAFSSQLIGSFEEGEIEAVLLYSPRTARIFKELLEQHEIGQHMQKVDCYCLSQNVADKISEISFKNIYIAKNPTQDAMLGLIKDNN